MSSYAHTTGWTISGSVSLRCLERKTDKPFQITIVDNNSTDGTRSYVQSLITDHPHVRYVAEEKAGCQSCAQTKDGKSSEYEWTLYLDDDSIPPVGLIAEAFSLIESHPDVHVIGGSHG